MLESAKAAVKSVVTTGFRPSIDRVLRQARRRVVRADTRLLEHYLTSHASRKLQLGCGSNLLPGWLNSDVDPASSEVLTLDVTRPFPLPSGAFDFVFTEHVIEHLPYPTGVHMLRESFRVLRPGGRVRVSTPDLAFLVQLHREEKSPLQLDYLRWSTRNGVSWAPSPESAYVINNFVRAWGHRFIYDEQSLSHALGSVGFGSIRRCRLNESEAPELRGLENESRMPPGFLQLETFTLEGTRLS